MSDTVLKKSIAFFGAFLVVFFAGAGVGFLAAGVVQAPTTETLQAGSQQEEIETSLTIDYGNGDVQSFPDEPVSSGSSVFDLLKAAERRHGITLETREFSGVGVFVEAIHGVHNTNDMYWQYWVNGEYANRGASQYELDQGDEVLWKRTNERPE